MSFCPNCRTEYISGITICADCNDIVLVESIPPEEESKTLNPVYVTYNQPESDFIQHILLEKNIDCAARDLQVSQFPVQIGKLSQIRIMVESEKINEAREIIEQAITDDAISKKGFFICTISKIFFSISRK